MNKDSGKVFIAGAGKSGIEAAKMVLSMGGNVLLFDSNEKIDRQSVFTQFENIEKDSALNAKLEICVGDLLPNRLRGVTLAVISPGIPLDADFIKELDESHIPIIGELELAYQASKGRIAAITGTNGKTTTTALTGEILRTSFEDVHVVGNIGKPFCSEALSTTSKSAIIIEVSSFMLETISEFRPYVSAILNITPDHLDRHKTMARYTQCKEAIAMNQTENDYIILNYMDPILRKFGNKESLKPQVIWFSSGEIPPGDAIYMKDDDIYINTRGIEQKVINAHELLLLGRHNYENVMAAIGIGLKMGVELKNVIKAARKFKPVEHRIEFVRERAKVKYYNDSKGTNPEAAIQGLNAMPGPTILIAGGYDKHASYDEWVSLFPGKVKKLVLLGQTRDKINECCKKYGFTEITYAEDMDEAVKTCASYADEGDYVLLSPGCASWGMFKDYEERGRVFKDCVNDL